MKNLSSIGLIWLVSDIFISSDNIDQKATPQTPDNCTSDSADFTVNSQFIDTFYRARGILLAIELSMRVA
jgi:hypothetical protein